MSKQPEALWIASELDCHNASLDRKAAKELRRLHAANVELLEALKCVIDDKAPTYHDCTDDGEPECGWCVARAAIAKHGSKS